MEAKDLRIGSYVNYRGQLNKVLGIHSPCPTGDRFDGKYVIEINPPDSFNVCLHELKPLLLTEEWLLKFGFKKMIDDYFELNILNGFKLESDGFDVVQFVYGELYITEVTHVHQLQNLYWCLTGEELILKNYGNR